ncbi:2-oxoisovalerate dehydrogenase E1 component [Salinibacter ruber]|uniref:alpha-ketoacid dehydrogenase subunit alpha/beta n=1 Tax=Salinibacter ruber TaxID=146919 RepID=UPI001ABB84FB|nr:dehydrogenase E1 component subunit alpha/beta [Salinibacter ruber]MCS3628170.1 2-oxoisovalerate dehydrogenase E1 component [Salinibacter ruber]MCS3644719.1 2-oxoisovalerate dehydrogenase E1 component [Salinibacter ruber]MCS3666247.1 2-oxoisovalerate dehydrogenase E1 component [Salinibacter ruber]MCS3824653.1 2-oxoisovalerate dehydrogenase E1 component [Salinibacter ruber]MCS4145079.1 2-oxoisovalerate dehydrogenase E1 component [Salinibacter ruber]
MSSPESSVNTGPDLDAEALCRALLEPRVIEEKMLTLIRQGRIAKWFSGYGQEAVAAGTAWALDDRDYILPMHRNLGVWTTRDVDRERLFCQLMGKKGGFTNGRDRTFHFGLPAKNLVGMISHMAAMLPVACGLGQAVRFREADRVACAFCGDGGTREGDFHEALNLASVWDLPVLFLVENNGYGLSTPTDEAVAPDDIADAAAGYDMPGMIVDGNDVFAVIEAVREARAHARTEGPVLLEMKTFRVRGHEEASGTAYVPDELIEEWKEKDPLDRFAARVREEGLLGADRMESIRAELESAVDELAEWALDRPAVTSTPEAERDAVFAPSPDPDPPSPDADTEETRFIDAIQDGLRAAMRDDDEVIVMGQDIAEYGGAFKVTDGFVDEFGSERIRNTPIIEDGALGAGMGLSIEGLPAVVEMQYADFISCGFNQTVNNLATTHYRWGQPVNVTIRAPFGGGIGAGPFHSQSREAWFTHTPGLKVVVPATPRDAKGLLRTAVADPNPVLFFEHKKLYRSVRGAVPTEAYTLPFGEARVAREGTDATIVTYGVGVHWALAEAEHQAEANGVELEVVDLRTLVPWDRDTVRQSLDKTNRLLVLHEASRTAGFGAEVAAELGEIGFELLDAPITRVAAEDLPVPNAKPLEDEIFSATARLRPKVEDLLAF